MEKTPDTCGPTKCGTEPKCEGCAFANKQAPAIEPGNELNSIKKVVAVMSGKGGVGKSLVSSLLAVLLRRKGYKVGVLDADITGPSIPKMFGVTKKADSDGVAIYPVRTHNDISVMSVNLLLQREDDPVIWRGPILSGVVKQFWTHVVWGDLDCLIVDMPPGTGDVPLTVLQSLPVDGIVVVTSPQELVSVIVKKAVRMAQEMRKPVFGIIENMSYIKCPDCGRVIHIFGEGKTEAAASELGLEVLGRLTLEPALAALSDAGDIEKAAVTELDGAVSRLEELLNLD